MSAKAFTPPPGPNVHMSKNMSFLKHVYSEKKSPHNKTYIFLAEKGPPTPFDNYISKQSKTRTIIVHRSESLSIEILLRGGEASGNYVTSSTSLDDTDRRTDSQTKRDLEELSLLRNFF